MIFTENELKKWTLKSQKSQIAILLLNQCSISAVFPIVRFAGDQKTALTGESLYLQKNQLTSWAVASHSLLSLMVPNLTTSLEVNSRMKPEPFCNLLPLSIASLNSTNCAKVLLLMSSLSMHILNNDTKQRNLWRDETKTAKIPGHLTHLLQ